MTVTITPARPEDVDELIASAAALFAEDGGTRDRYMDTGWPQRAGRPYYAGLIEGADTLALLARDGTRVVGHLTGGLSEPAEVRSWVRAAQLISLRIAETHRRHGVAGRLIAAFVDWAREHGADELKVVAYATNEGALTTYRRYGFTDFEITLRRDAAGPR